MARKGHDTDFSMIHVHHSADPTFVGFALWDRARRLAAQRISVSQIRERIDGVSHGRRLT